MLAPQALGNKPLLGSDALFLELRMLCLRQGSLISGLHLLVAELVKGVFWCEPVAPEFVEAEFLV